jgi:hypothetical protein
MTDENDDNKKTIEDIEKLKKALVHERTEHRVTKDRLKTITEQLAERDALSDGSKVAAINGHIANVVKSTVAAQTAQQLRRIAELEAKLAEANTSSEVLRGQLSSRTITEVVREAADAAHVRKEALQDLLTLGNLELSIKNGEVLASDGRNVATWLNDRKKSSPWLFPTSQGSGARGSGDTPSGYVGDNPFEKGNFNLTKQSQLIRENPTLADRLQNEAKQKRGF